MRLVPTDLQPGKRRGSVCVGLFDNYGNLQPSEARELKQLREENTKLKRLVADLSLDRVMLQDVVKKKW